MAHIFRSEDKTGRHIYLTDERWSHINEEHPEVSPYLQEFTETLKNPTNVASYPYDKDIRYFYKYFKQRENKAKYLLIIVKYLNGEGFIITAYFVRQIK